MIQWGTAGEWASAIGALLVVGVTILIWRADHRRLEQRLVLDSAAKVNAWFQAPGTPPDNRTYWQMVVANQSDLPVYEWDAAVWWVRTGPPNGGPHYETLSMSSTTHGPLTPHVRRTADLRFLTPQGEVLPSNPSQDFRISVTWRDPKGNRWWIRYGGELRESTDRWPLPWTLRAEPPGLPDLDALALRALQSGKKKPWWKKEL